MMKLLSRIFAGCAFMAVSLGALAVELPFNQKVFDDLRAAGKPVAIHVHATWCGVCRKQTEITASLMRDPQFKDLTLMKADFGTEKVLLKTLQANFQSTFIAFKGNTETARSIGDTSPDSIAALLRKAL